MKCDHTLMQSKFCPECGEAINADPAVSLLAHVRKMHKRLNEAQYRAPQRDKLLVKYAGWVEFIESTLAARRVKPEGAMGGGA